MSGGIGGEEAAGGQEEHFDPGGGASVEVGRLAGGVEYGEVAVAAADGDAAGRGGEQDWRRGEAPTPEFAQSAVEEQ